MSMLDPVLESERHHLSSSRAALHRMREATTQVDAALAGNAVSTAYLKQVLYRRMLSLEDDPTVPLFFGRLDYAAALGAEFDERLYIGRRHITGELGGEPLVMDWRAPMSLPFYRARPGDPMGVAMRRRFGFRHGEITAYEDEDLVSTSDAGSRLLAEEIERPRTGPMRDIVATIQPDQDVLVRTDLATSLCIQGAPGTGKTAVGLHRAAYLLYAHRDQLSRSGVLVVGPNESFLSYIGDVLPALGEIDARQTTAEGMLTESTGAKVRGSDSAAVATLKGDARLAEVLSRALWSGISAPTVPLAVPFGSRVVRVPSSGIAAAIAALRERGVRYEAGRRLLAQRLAHEVLVRLEAQGETTDDRLQNSVARSGPVKAVVAAVWPAVTPAGLLFRLFSDAEALADASEGVLSDAEQAMLRWATPPRTAGSAKWSVADLALLDEIGDLLDRTGSVGHVIIDEAQDLAPMALRAVGRRASTGSITVLGDLAQATTPWGARDWAVALGHLGKPDAGVTELTEGFRVPGAVIEYAARLLPSIAPGLAAPRSVRHSRGDLDLRLMADPVAAVAEAAREVAGREGTVGVIVADTQLRAVRKALAHIPYTELGQVSSTEAFESHLDLVPASLAKGLEFDHVLLVDPAAIVAAEADELTGWRRLYVCLTRAVTSLVVLHDGELPSVLR